MLMSTFDHCPLCGAKNIGLLSGFEKLFLFKCGRCGFVFDQRIPTEKELIEHYSQYSYSTRKPCPPPTIKSYNNLLDFFAEFKETGNILDVGCGQGDFLNEARKRGWTIYGYEYSAAAISLCRDRDISVCSGKFTAGQFADIQFDVVTSFEVLEHLNNMNDHFAVVNKKLRTGGLYYCTTPNFNALLRYLERDAFSMICYPEHISFYTKKSLRYLCELHGFSVNKMLTTGIDIGRLRNHLRRKKISLERTEMRLTAKKQTDAVRAQVDVHWLYGRAKCVVNSILSFIGTGDTLLKGFLVKK
jgi:2-polyprenyl-3-methyl-5-hydroxy-6-metoxy-1,4-benzoquinol methylase